MVRSVAIATALLLGAGAADALEFGSCGHRVAERSIAACSRLIERPHKSPLTVAPLLLRRAIAHNSKSDYDLAIVDLNKALRLDPGAGQAYYHRGFAYEKKGDRDRAISDYRSAYWFNDSVVKSVFAQTIEGLQRLGVTEAPKVEVPEHKPAVTPRPNGLSDVLKRFRVTLRCEMFLRHAEYDWALAECNSAVRQYPNSFHVYVSRGDVYTALGKFERAFADFERALQLYPEYAPAYASRGAAFTRKGQLDRAIAALDRAIQLDPQLATAFSGRAFAYEKKGERENAIADYRKAREIHEARTKDPAFGPSVEGLKRLGATP